MATLAAEMNETSGFERSRELSPTEIKQAQRYGVEHDLKSVPVQFRQSGKPITRDDHTDLVMVFVSVPGAGF